jgi:arabinofuranan 3-O-arabinosyltransferase
VETERGVIEQPVRATSDPQPLRVAPGTTRWLRIRITGLAVSDATPVFTRAAIYELAIGGLRPARTSRRRGVSY